MSDFDRQAESMLHDPAWRMRCSTGMLQQRAQLYGSIRQFFAERGVLEVDTPVLSQAAACDLNIESIQAQLKASAVNPSSSLYLQTSPEYAMKRLLASGSGPIYQIAHAFRDGESGRHHNPEFAMLEWYQTDYSLPELMDETRDLVLECLGQTLPVQVVSYAKLFENELGIDPHMASVTDLALVAAQRGNHDAEKLCEDCVSDWLDYLFSSYVQPSMRPNVLYLVHDYPACQAMLAKIRPGTPNVAERFELFLNGLELANGFHELTDADEQARRFQDVIDQRASLGRSELPMPDHLLDALKHGLPACCGVAVGLDRLLMLISGADHIDQVLSFPVQRA